MQSTRSDAGASTFSSTSTGRSTSTRNELAKALARINPARFAGMVDPRRVLIIEAAADTCAATASRERLWQAMGRPERIAYLYDHRMAFLAMTFLAETTFSSRSIASWTGASPMHRAAARCRSTWSNASVDRRPRRATLRIRRGAVLRFGPRGSTRAVASRTACRHVLCRVHRSGQHSVSSCLIAGACGGTAWRRPRALAPAVDVQLVHHQERQLGSHARPGAMAGDAG